MSGGEGVGAGAGQNKHSYRGHLHGMLLAACRSPHTSTCLGTRPGDPKSQECPLGTLMPSLSPELLPPQNRPAGLQVARSGEKEKEGLSCQPHCPCPPGHGQVLLYRRSSFSLENWSCGVCTETYFLDVSSVESGNSKGSEPSG